MKPGRSGTILRGAWSKLFGPILFYDLVRTGRRRRYLVVRFVYGLFLTGTLFFVYACWFLGEYEPLKAMLTGSVPAAELASFASSFFYVFVVIQLLVAPQQIQSLRNELTRVEAGVVEARRLQDYPRGRFPPNTSAYDSIQVCQVLEWDALLRAQEMSIDGALEDCIAIVNACRAIGDEPTFSAQLARHSIQTIAIDTAERVLSQGQPSESVLATLQRRLAEESEHPLILCALRGERAAVDNALQRLQSGNTKAPRYILISRGSLLSLEEAGFILSGPLKKQRAEILRINTELVEVAKLPLAEQALASTPLLGQSSIGPFSFKSMLIPTFQLGWWRGMILANQARLRAAAVAVAAERFRRMHGRWPEGLTELGPTLLPRVPDDPYGGNPLIYRRLADGVVVYSVGSDGTDNGGKLHKGHRSSPSPSGTDVGVRLWDVDRRRQPAANP